MGSLFAQGLQAVKDAIKRSNDAVAEGRRLTKGARVSVQRSGF